MMNRFNALAACALFLLSGCQQNQPNPLQTHTKIESATFLMNASANVEKRLHFSIKADERGYGYLECMEGKKNPEINCDSLYQAMLTFAKEKHYPGFENMTLAQLTDLQSFEPLSDDYVEIMMTTWPTYYQENQS